MASGYSIGVASDTKEFSQGIASGVVKPLQDAADTIKALSDTSDSASDKITAALRAEQAATEKNAASNKSAAQSAVEGYQQQQEAAELSVGEINRVQKEGVKTGASAITQIVAQSAQGFDGTASSALNSLTNLSAGIAAFGGPEIAAVGGAVALFTSLISGAFQKADADSKQFEADVSSTTTTLEKLGISGVDGVTAVDDALKKFSTTTDGSNSDLEALKGTADEAGVSWTEYADAIGGSTKAQVALFAEVGKQTKTVQEQIDALGTARGKEAGAERLALTNQLDGLNAVSSALKQQNATLGESKTRVDDLTAAQKANDGATQAATQAAIDYGSKSEAVFSGLGDKLAQEQADANQAAIDASDKTKKTVVANDVETVADFISGLQQTTAALAQSNADKLAIYEKFGTDAGKAVINSAGNNPKLLDALAAATPSDVATIKAQYATAGKESGENLIQAAQDAAKGKSVQIGSSVVPPDMGAVLKTLQKQADNGTLKLNAEVFVGGKRVI